MKRESELETASLLRCQRILAYAYPPICIICVIAFTLAACTKNQTPPQMSPEVVIEEIKTQSLSLTNELPGRTTAYQSAQVRPQVNGIIKRRLFKEGTDIKEGQVLYLVDPSSYQATYEHAKGELARAQAAAHAAQPKAQRYQELVELDAISKQEGDDAISALRQSEASVVIANATLQTARINLDNTEIKAPISGRIGTSNYTAGTLVSANQSEALATINQFNPIYVDIVQSSAQLLSLRRKIDAGNVATVNGKAQVTLILEDGVAYERSGTLEVVDAEVKESTGSVKLRAVFPNPDHLILPGMYVKALLSLATSHHAILVPQKAISRNSKGQAMVLAVDQDNKVTQRIIETADAIGDRWVVLSGLEVGDKIIVEGTQKTRPGQTVRIVPAMPQSTVPDSDKAVTDKPAR